MKPRTAPPAFRVLFKPYANLDSKIRLEAGHEKIEVRMSDQLRTAPDSVREALAWVLLGKLDQGRRRAAANGADQGNRAPPEWRGYTRARPGIRR
jgi:hypothetical protein